MKKYLLMIGLVLFVVTISCGSKNSAGNYRETVIALDENLIESAIDMLPEVLDFSDAYKKGLSEAELESPDFNENFYSALGKDKNIVSLAMDNGFESGEHFVDVYNNIVYAYVSIIRDLTDFSNQMIELKFQIEQERDAIEAQLKMTNVNTVVLYEMRETVGYKETVYNNILLVYKYKDKISEIEKSRDGKK